MSIPRVLGKDLLVTVIEKENVKNGLIIPETMNRDHKECLVVGIGSEVKETSIGNVVLISCYDGRAITVNEKKYLVVKESEILAII